MAPTDANQHTECVAVDTNTMDRVEELSAETDMADTTARDCSPHERPMGIGERDSSGSEEHSTGDMQREENEIESPNGGDEKDVNMKVAAIGEPTGADDQGIPSVGDDGEVDSKDKANSSTGAVEVDDITGIVDAHGSQDQSMASSKSNLNEAQSPAPDNASKGGKNELKKIKDIKAAPVKLSQVKPPAMNSSINTNTSATADEEHQSQTHVRFWRDESSRASITSENNPTVHIRHAPPPPFSNAHHLFRTNASSISQLSQSHGHNIPTSQLFPYRGTTNAGAPNDNEDEDGSEGNNGDGERSFCQQHRFLLIIGGCALVVGILLGFSLALTGGKRAEEDSSI